MASVTSEGGESLNTELNLVPFIDLLSTLVLFLLVTAVWMQVAAIPAAVESKGKSAAAQTHDQKIMLHVAASGYRLTWPANIGAGLTSEIGRTHAGYDADRLVKLLKLAGSKAGAKLPLVAVSGDDDVQYGSMIQAVDAVKSIGGQAVAISTN